MPLDTHNIATELRCALDPVAFAIERLGFTPDPWQAAELRQDEKNTLLCCSRQSGKSTTAAIRALHTSVYTPEALVLLGSPSMRQSRELFAKVAGFMHLIEPRPILEEDNKLSFMLGNGSRVVSLPGTAGTVRGFSAPDLIIEDEASFVDDGFYLAVRPMLAVSGGRLILMSTPYGKRGHFYEAWKSDDDWNRVLVTAHDCPRITAKFLESERRAMGDLWFRQEYLCEFSEVMDAVFRMSDIERAVTDDVRPLFDTPPTDDNVKPLNIARVA